MSEKQNLNMDLVAISCRDVVVLRSQVGCSNNVVHVEVTVIIL